MHGAFHGAARFHMYARTLSTASGVELPESLRLEWMCLVWQLNGAQTVLDQLQQQIDIERGRAQAMLEYSEAEGLDLPDEFIPPDEVRLDSTYQTMRLYAADAVENAELRAEALNELAATIRERFWTTQQVSMFVMDAGTVQVLHRLADKSIALQRIAQHLGVTREQVMAIGDGANDLGMIEWSGFGVAVANAVPAVKEMADAIVPSNDDLGVARAIQRFVLHRP